MNCFERYLVELLQGHITYEGNVVPVVRDFSNAPRLPVITLDLSAGVTQEYEYHEYMEKERVYHMFHSNINVSIWCNTEEERESITDQVLQCFYDENNYHYRYCSQYDDGNCKWLSSSCPARNVGKDGKYQCTNMDEYNYQSLKQKHGVIDDTVTVLPPFTMDEMDKHPPLLRSILRCDGYYNELVREFGKAYPTKQE